MPFFDVPVGSLSEADFQWLIDAGIAEDDRLDFKREMYGSSDEERRECLRDITAMANHRGGRIVIGIEEGPGNVAVFVPGIEPGVPPNHAEDWDTWIRKLAVSSIAERIPGIQVVRRPLASGKEVVVVELPESAAAPHMVTYKQLNQFWRRVGTEKHLMSIDEIRESVERVATNQARIDRFLERRLSALLTVLDGRPACLIRALPAYFREDEELLELGPASPARPRMTSPQNEYLPGGTSVGSLNPYRILEGLRTESRPFPPPRDYEDRTAHYLEVHASGYVEFVEAIPTSPQGVPLVSRREFWYLISFLHLLRTLNRIAATASPVVIEMQILNASQVRLFAGAYAGQRAGTGRAVLNLGLRRLESPNPEDRDLVQRFADRLWHAYGIESASIYAADGTLLSN